MKNRVTEMRIQYGMTQQTLAEEVTVSARTIISLEKGQYKPSIMLAYRLAKRFEMSIETLFCREENRRLEDEAYEDL